MYPYWLGPGGWGTPFPGSAPFGPCGQFWGVKIRAANICGCGGGDYTVDMFYEDFPIFHYRNEDDELVRSIPEHIIQMFVDAANQNVCICRYGKMWRYVVGLYVAHFATLYLRSYAEESPTGDPNGSASGGDVIGLVTSEKLGDATITFATTTASTYNDIGSWGETEYGRIYTTFAKAVSAGGSVVI